MDISSTDLRQFCERMKVRRLMMFGSVARGDSRPDSDLDLLVEFEDGVQVGFFDLAQMESELSLMLGRTVDLRTPNELSSHFRDAVISKAETVYVS